MTLKMPNPRFHAFQGDLLQTRTLQAGGNLVYEDGPVVRAMKQGSVLILEGVEKAERNVLPVLNNSKWSLLARVLASSY